MKSLFILLAVLAVLGLPAIVIAATPADVVKAAHKVGVAPVLDLQGVNASEIFGETAMQNVPERWLFTKGAAGRNPMDRGYSLITFMPVFNQTKAFYEGVPASLIDWSTQLPPPIGSV